MKIYNCKMVKNHVTEVTVIGAGAYSTITISEANAITDAYFLKDYSCLKVTLNIKYSGDITREFISTIKDYCSLVLIQSYLLNSVVITLVHKQSTNIITTQLKRFKYLHPLVSLTY